MLVGTVSWWQWVRLMLRLVHLQEFESEVALVSKARMEACLQFPA